jgi:hypothetical protein
MDKDAYLPVQLKGELTNRPGHIHPDNQIACDPPVRQSFQRLQMVFFQAFDITDYITYDQTSVCNLPRKTSYSR